MRVRYESIIIYVEMVASLVAAERGRGHRDRFTQMGK